MSAPQAPAAVKTAGYLVLGATLAHRIAQAASKAVEPLAELADDLDRIIATYTTGRTGS